MTESKINGIENQPNPKKLIVDRVLALPLPPAPHMATMEILHHAAETR
jgi:hypothetical protein